MQLLTYLEFDGSKPRGDFKDVVIPLPHPDPWFLSKGRTPVPKSDVINLAVEGCSASVKLLCQATDLSRDISLVKGCRGQEPVDSREGSSSA